MPETPSKLRPPLPLVVLQHPQESREPLSTVPLIGEVLDDVTVRVDERPQDRGRARGPLAGADHRPARSAAGVDHGQQRLHGVRGRSDRRRVVDVAQRDRGCLREVRCAHPARRTHIAVPPTRSSAS